MLVIFDIYVTVGRLAFVINVYNCKMQTRIDSFYQILSHVQFGFKLDLNYSFHLPNSKWTDVFMETAHSINEIFVYILFFLELGDIFSEQTIRYIASKHCSRPVKVGTRKRLSTFP